MADSKKEWFPSLLHLAAWRIPPWRRAGKLNFELCSLANRSEHASPNLGSSKPASWPIASNNLGIRQSTRIFSSSKHYARFWKVWFAWGQNLKESAGELWLPIWSRAKRSNPAGPALAEPKRLRTECRGVPQVDGRLHVGRKVAGYLLSSATGKQLCIPNQYFRKPNALCWTRLP